MSLPLWLWWTVGIALGLAVLYLILCLLNSRQFPEHQNRQGYK